MRIKFFLGFDFRICGLLDCSFIYYVLKINIKIWWYNVFYNGLKLLCFDVILKKVEIMWCGGLIECMDFMVD